MFLYGRFVIPFHCLSSKSRNSKMFTHSDFKMALSFAVIVSIAATTLKFINNARTQENWNFIFECEETDQLALTLEYNLKIAVREFIFHNTINFRANLKRKIPRYSRTIMKSFLGTVLTTTFCVNALSKKIFMHLSTKSHG